MLVWLSFAILAALAIGLVIWPLAVNRGGVPTRAAYDRAVYRDQLKEIARDLAIGAVRAVRPEPAPRSSQGADADDVVAAAELSPEERTEMVRGMVERLAARLKDTPDDLQGWLRLGRAYEVLKEPEKAADAY